MFHDSLLQRQHIYVMMEKGENDGFTNVVEKSVLYCESSPFANDLNGQFTSSSTLRVRDVVRTCCFNPITAAACKNSGLTDARTFLQTVYFPAL